MLSSSASLEVRDANVFVFSFSGHSSGLAGIG